MRVAVTDVAQVRGRPLSWFLGGTHLHHVRPLIPRQKGRPRSFHHASPSNDLRSFRSMIMPSRASTGRGRSGRLSARARSFERLESTVRTVRVVMEEHKAAGIDSCAKSDSGVDARMTPPDPRRVLLLGVLGIVENHVGAVGERAARDPGEGPRFDAGESRLVIRQVGEA